MTQAELREARDAGRLVRSLTTGRVGTLESIGTSFSYVQWEGRRRTYYLSPYPNKRLKLVPLAP